MSLQDLRQQYGDTRAIRSNRHRSAIRPLDVLSKSDLAMTLHASDLIVLAVRLEEQTRNATEHLEQA